MKNRIVLMCALLLTPVMALATVTGTATSASFTCTGSTGPFSFTFPIDTAAAMTVTQNGTVLASSAYTIAPVNNSYDNGGSVTLNTACPSGQTLVLQRVTPITQLTQYTPYMPAMYANIENGLDQLTEIDQELSAGKAGIGSCPAGNFETGDTVNGPTCASVSGGGGVVSVGPSGYAPLAAAFAALPASGGTIQLAQDLSVSTPQLFTIANTGVLNSFTLDLAGHTINCSNTSSYCIGVTVTSQGGGAVRIAIKNGTINYTGSSANVVGLEVLNTATTTDLNNLLISNFAYNGDTCLVMNNAEGVTVTGGTRLSNCYQAEHITGVSTTIAHYAMQINYGTAGVPITIDDGAVSIFYYGGTVQSSSNKYAVVLDSTGGILQSIHFDGVHFENDGDTTSATAIFDFNVMASHNIFNFSVKNGLFAADTNGVNGYMFNFGGDGTAAVVSPVIENNETSYGWSIGSHVFPSTVISQSGATFADQGMNLNGVSGFHLWPQTGGHHYNLWAGDSAQRGDGNNLTLADMTASTTPAHYVASTQTWTFPNIVSGSTSKGSISAGTWTLYSITASDANYYAWFAQNLYTDSDLVLQYNSTTNRLRFDNVGNMYLGSGAGTEVFNSSGVLQVNAPNLSGTPALPNGTTATTQSANSADAKLATDNTVLNSFATPPTAGFGSATPEPVAATTSTATVGFAGGSTVTFTLGGATVVGTGATTPTCATNHVCDNFAGQFSFTTGTSISANNAAIVTVNFSPSRTNYPNCFVSMVDESAATIYAPFANSTASTMYFVGYSNLTASHLYLLTYVCGGK